MNEASVYLPDWKEVFWGVDKYATLLKIKNKYDPHGLLKCYRCVSWEDIGESRMSGFENLGE